MRSRVTLMSASLGAGSPLGWLCIKTSAAAGVEKQHGEAFAFGVEVGIGGDVQAPVVGGFLRGVAKLQGFRRGAFAERDNLVFVGLRGEFEGLNKLVHAGECGSKSGVHISSGGLGGDLVG